MKQNSTLKSQNTSGIRRMILGLLLALQFVAGSLLAQTTTVTGRVTDTGGPMPGVSIRVKGTSTSATTNNEGNYSISASPGAVLIFSFISYTTREITVGDRNNIDVVLEAESKALSEVVVVGYGVQKKVSLTGAVSEIKGEELTRRPVSSLQQAMQGQLPGLTVLDQGGSPGNSNATIRVRGITTLSNNNPLIIVDGIEQTLASINPDDVESISVLKDASSTAIYGSRAANGVILITSKRAKEGRSTITYNTFYAAQKTISNPEHMEIGDYLRLQNENYTNAGSAAPYSEAAIQDYVNGDREKYPLPYDWYNAMLRPAPQLNHSLAVAGGSENFRGRLSMRYQDQDGIIANTNSKINEIRVNTDLKVSNRVNFSGDVNYRNVNSLQPQNITEIFRLMLQNSIFTVPKYSDGAYGAGPQGNNPLLLAEIGGTDKVSNDFVTGNVKGTVEILKGLKFTTQLGALITNRTEKEFTTSYEVRDRVNSAIIRKSRNINTLTESRNKTTEVTINSLLNYGTVIGGHNINALAGYSQIENNGNSLSAFRQGFYNNDIRALSQGTNDATKNNGGGESRWGLRSYFGRLNYTFLDKYLFEANARYDGSSRFAGNNRYSFFPSFSAGWRLSQEKFWEKLNLSNLINEFKIRGSWGKTGNQAVDLYSYYSTLNISTYTFNGLPVQGYSQKQLTSEDLTWETTTQTDIGVDVQFKKGRFSLGVDHYNKQTDGILLLLPVPGTLGLTASPQNAGRVDNKGWEFTGAARNRFGQFGLDVTLNYNINKNNVVSLAGTGPYIVGSDLDPRYITGEGYPIDSFWGYKTDGLFQTQAEADAAPLFQRKAVAGDVRYVDVNGDGKLNADDMTFIGMQFPKHTFGGSINFTYKSFGLNMLLQGTIGQSMARSRALIQSGTAEAFTHKIYTNNTWTPQNPGARFPRTSKLEARNQVTSDMLMTKSDYIRMKNIQLQYQLPSSFTKKFYVDRMNVYVSGTNIFTISPLNEWNLDPEAVSGYQNYYPQVAVYTVGVNLNF
jgi:TonB-linked SusC/RagA family outer membrane protein